jgi:hypothetical protein
LAGNFNQTLLPCDVNPELNCRWIVLLAKKNITEQIWIKDGGALVDGTDLQTATKKCGGATLGA